MTAPADLAPADVLRRLVALHDAGAIPREGLTTAMIWLADHAEPGPWSWMQPGPARETR